MVERLADLHRNTEASLDLECLTVELERLLVFTEALVAIRNEDTDRFRNSLSTGKPNEKLFDDICHINLHLEEAEGTLQLLSEFYDVAPESAVYWWRYGAKLHAIYKNREMEEKYRQWGADREQEPSGRNGGFSLLAIGRSVNVNGHRASRHGVPFVDGAAQYRQRPSESHRLSGERSRR